MTTNYEKVKEFHKTFGHPISESPTLKPFRDENTDEQVINLRLDLIDEEVAELHEAMENRDIVGVSDALTDILYVVYGAGATFGIDLDATYAEVHRSNMSKLGEDGMPIYREDGKILKGNSYSPPNLKKILFPEDDM